MSVNVDALRRVLEYVTEHPEKHDQSAWAKRTECGTTACLAGHLVLMEGLTIAWPVWKGDGPEPPYWSSLAAYGLTDGADIGDTAAEILRIAPYTEDGEDEYNDGYRHLFDSSNTLADLWHIAARLTDGAIEIPERFRSVA